MSGTNYFEKNAPLPPPKWEGIFKAIDGNIQCPQYLPTLGVVGKEDCLKINVYVPVMTKKPLPVMVFIHGGAFIMGNGGKFMYAPDFLLKQEVIVVTFNYRLGTLGFLCLGIKEAPGNAAMKDQVAALKWIKKNIAAFGGDPENITIFGQSAGGASVSLLLASKVTENLFKRAIVMSGSSLANWSINRYPVLVASQLAKDMGFDTEDPLELYKIFSTKSYEDLIMTTVKRQEITKLLHLPCIERSISGVEPFIDDVPYNLLMKNTKNISVIYGSTDREGLFFVGKETEAALMSSNKGNLFADDLEFKSIEEQQEVNQKIREYYFGIEDISKRTLMNLCELYTHLYFSIPVILEAQLVTRNIEAKIYNYYFKYSGGRNFVKYLSGWANETGACHGDDLAYLFKTSLLPLTPKGNDKTIIDWMTVMFANFAKYGDPTPSSSDIPVRWTPHTKNQLNFLTIDKDLKMGPIPEPGPYKFWSDIYKKYRKTVFS